MLSHRDCLFPQVIAVHVHSGQENRDIGLKDSGKSDVEKQVTGGD